MYDMKCYDMIYVMGYGAVRYDMIYDIKIIEAVLHCISTYRLFSTTLSQLKMCDFLSGEDFNYLNAELNPICHFLALLGSHPLFHVSRIRVKDFEVL
jgi:hypothetical protein